MNLLKRKKIFTCAARSHHESHLKFPSLYKTISSLVSSRSFHLQITNLVSIHLSHSSFTPPTIPQLSHYQERPLLEISSERWGLTFKRCCQSRASFLATLKPGTKATVVWRTVKGWICGRYAVCTECLCIFKNQRAQFNVLYHTSILRKCTLELFKN